VGQPDTKFRLYQGCNYFDKTQQLFFQDLLNLEDRFFRNVGVQLLPDAATFVRTELNFQLYSCKNIQTRKINSLAHAWNQTTIISCPGGILVRVVQYKFTYFLRKHPSFIKILRNSHFTRVLTTVLRLERQVFAKCDIHIMYEIRPE
jgi:hypothetical protein